MDPENEMEEERIQTKLGIPITIEKDVRSLHRRISAAELNDYSEKNNNTAKGVRVSASTHTQDTSFPRKRNFLFLSRELTRIPKLSPEVDVSEHENVPCEKVVHSKDIKIESNVSDANLNGSTASFKMPRLTRAPGSQDDVPVPSLKPIKQEVNEEAQTKIRKLPALTPIKILLCSADVENNADRGVPEEKPCINSSPSQKPSGTKQILWKCKKCSFKHECKETVMFHVRLGHKSTQQQSPDLHALEHTPGLESDSNEKHSQVLHQDLELKDSVGNHKEDINGVLYDTVDQESKESNRNSPRITISKSSKGYNCYECPYITACKSQFINHLRFHRPRNTAFKCSHCSYNVTHKHLLLQHLRVHGVTQITSEMYCAMETETNRNSERNAPMDGQPIMNKTRSPAQGSSLGSRPSVLVWQNGRPYRMYRCRFCPQAFNRSSYLNEHEYSHKSNVNQGSLRDLPSKTKRITSLVKGLNDVRSNVNNKLQRTLYVCEECPARFFVEKELMTHYTFHQKEYEVNCDQCTYSTRKDTHLLSHMKVHGQEYQLKTRKFLEMYQMAPRFNSVATANSHSTFTSTKSRIPINPNETRTNSEKVNIPIICQKCPTKFQTQVLYQDHLNFHGKKSKHQCSYCDYGAETNVDLAIHKLFHAGSEVNIAGVGGTEWSKMSPTKNLDGLRNKQYRCDKCPFAFSKRDRYELHLKQHGSNQRFTCSICDFSVNLYVNYVQHLKKHCSDLDLSQDLEKKEKLPAWEKNFQCTHCPYATIDQSAMEDHNRQHISSESQMASPSTENVNSVVEGEYRCVHCDFVTVEENAYIAHTKLHFQLSDSLDVPDVFMFLQGVDILVDDENNGEVFNETESSSPTQKD